MTMTDPIADMLARIRNANQAGHEIVQMPSSKQKAELARILKQEGYIEDYSIENKEPGMVLHVTLRRDEKTRRITGLKRISKPGLRVYAKRGKLPRVLGGMGTAIVSTSKGMMTDKEAARKKVGGEVIAFIW